MLIALLKNDRLIILISPLILLAGVVVKLVNGLEPLHADSIFYSEFIQSWPSWLNYILGAVFALIAGFIANQTIQNLGVLGRISNLPNLLMVLLFFILPDRANFFYLWVIFFLQLAVLRWVEQIPDEQKKIQLFVFNASLVIGIILLLQSWSILYFVLVFQSLAAVGMVTLRRLIIGVLGLVLPFYFYASFQYITSGLVKVPSFDITLIGLLFPFDWQSLLALVFVAFLLLMALSSLFATSGSSTLRVKRRWMIVVVYLFITAFIVLNSGFIDMAIFMILPSAIVFSRVLMTMKNQLLGNLYLLIFFAILFLYNT